MSGYGVVTSGEALKTSGVGVVQWSQRKSWHKVQAVCTSQERGVHMALNFTRETSALDFETQVHKINQS